MVYFTGLFFFRESGGAELVDRHPLEENFLSEA
jgi:hypothetical protein